MLLKYYIWIFRPCNIYIFSKTASFDLAYRPVLWWLADQIMNDKESCGMLNLFETIDMDVIWNVVES